MNPRQKIASIFAVIALLGGNVAGWVHLHQHSSDRCCGTGLVCHQDVSHQVLDAGDSVSHSHCHHSHHCGDLVVAGETPTHQHPTVKHSATGHSATGHPAPPAHDSGDCAICQLLFNYRNAALPLIAAVVLQTAAPIQSVPADCQVAGHGFTDSVHFLRGPPLV
ncbi:hypothetical protein NHH03_00835 [Stieleria sp. TO1_6]|uniref:hypothetical protein n=1 Tax=Stieleria tagensis TaxID=2956795 RepID=UPI00209B5F33|nr:hypothetical protein [Stieleria tagensis]MCO8120261.1 hypothetical protein [Stieleria tagensis]